MDLGAFVDTAINLLLAAQPCLTVFLLTLHHDRSRLWKRGPLYVAGMIAFLFFAFHWFNAGLVFVVLIALPMNVGLCISIFKTGWPRRKKGAGTNGTKIRVV